MRAGPAVDVNPEAHFGRERWQAAVAEFLLAAVDDPSLLTTFDCLGNRLDLGIEDALNREGNWVFTGYGRPNDGAFSQGKVDDEVPAFFRPGAPVDEPSLWPAVSPIRKHITKVGAEAGWENVPVPSHRSPVPFDEPVLGIIGMWREGGGASFPFALALGETMLRVGQRYLAWDAFERAARLADRATPDPKVRVLLLGHCRRRQSQIEGTLLFRPDDDGRRPPWQFVSPPPAQETVAALRSKFDAELAFGEETQRAFPRFEAKTRDAGTAITDASLFDAFQKVHGSIASPVGPEDWFVRVPKARAFAFEEQRRRAYGVFGAGLAAASSALLGLWRTRRRSRASRRTAKAGWTSHPLGA